MLYSVYAVLSVCCTRCKLLIMAWRDREGWLDSVLLGEGGVEDERDENRSGISSWETGTERIMCESKFTIPDTAGTSPYTAYYYTDMRFSQPNHASHTPDFSYPLVSSTSFSSQSFSSTTLPSLQNTKLGHSSLSLHVMIMSWHRVQHTPSTAYTKYSIHQVQAYTEYSIHPRLFVFPSFSWLQVDSSM